MFSNYNIKLIYVTKFLLISPYVPLLSPVSCHLWWLNSLTKTCQADNYSTNERDIPRFLKPELLFRLYPALLFHWHVRQTFSIQIWRGHSFISTANAILSLSCYTLHLLSVSKISNSGISFLLISRQQCTFRYWHCQVQGDKRQAKHSFI